MQLDRLGAELRAYCGGIPDRLEADGIKYAPYAIIQFANWLAWHAEKFPDPDGLRVLSVELRRTALALCGEPPQAKKPTLLERCAKLESDCENLRKVLNLRKGEPL